MESEKYFKNLSNKELDSLYAVLVRHPESVENMRQVKEIEKIMLDRYETCHNIKITKRTFSCMKADVLTNLTFIDSIINSAKETSNASELIHFLQKNKLELKKISNAINVERQQIVLNEAEKTETGKVKTEMRKTGSGEEREFIVYKDPKRVERMMLEFYKSCMDISLFVDADRDNLIKLIDNIKDAVVRYQANSVIHFIYEFSE